MAQVVALVDDLFFQAKLLETAKHLGVELRTCTTPDAMLAEIAKSPPRLVVVDLNARNNPIDAIERVQRPARDKSRCWDFSLMCKWNWRKRRERRVATT